MESAPVPHFPKIEQLHACPQLKIEQSSIGRFTSIQNNEGIGWKGGSAGEISTPAPIPYFIYLKPFIADEPYFSSRSFLYS